MKSFEINPLIQPLFDKLDHSGLILIPRQIYYEWSRIVLPEMEYLYEQEAELFLLPHFNSIEKTEEFCKLFFDLFFQYQLKKYSEDPSFWPINRNYEMFQQWFEVRFTVFVSSLK